MIFKDFIAEFYTHAFVGLTLQWIKNSMKDSPEIMVGKLNAVVEGSMLGALTRYSNYHQEKGSIK